MQLQAALDSGQPVVLTQGTFTVGATLGIQRPNPTLTGQGWQTVLQARNGLNDYVITFDGTTEVRGVFGHLEVQGNGANQTAGGGIDAPNSVQTLFERLHLTACWEAGLRLAGATGGAYGHHNRVLGCLFDNSLAVPGPGHGLLITASDENFVVASDFEYLGGTGAGERSGIHDMAGLNFVQSCNFVGGRSRGVTLRDASRTHISGCTFDGVGGDNVFLVGQLNRVEGCMFTSIGDQGSAANGVVLEYGAKQNIVLGNTFESSRTAGRTARFVYEPGAGGAGKNLVTNNQFRTVGALSKGAITLAGSGSVANNNLSGT